jgi:GLPGLI family protein
MNSQNISGIVTYETTMEAFNEKKLDSVYQTINKDKSKKKMNSYLKDMFRNVESVNAFLEFNHQESLYKLETKLQNDSKSKFNLNRILAGGDDIYYSNGKDKEYYYESSIFGELLLIEMKPKKWKITQESKKIGNYVCYKAIDVESENKVKKPIAWFTPLIPVSFGPKEYSGLPGLVLEVEMAGSTITATKIILNPTEEIVIKKPSKGKKITAEAYREMMEGFKSSRRKM